MIWDDVDQTFNQFERMLRDAGRVTHKGKSLVEEAGVNIDEALGTWVRSSLSERQLMFNTIVDKLNQGVVDIFGDDLLESVTKESLTRRPLNKDRRRAALDDAESTLRMPNQRIYDNRGLRFDGDTDFNITARFIENLTPQQLRRFYRSPL